MVKKQLIWSSIALLALLLVLGITGCDSSSTDDTEKSNNTTLSSIQIGSGEAMYFYSDVPKQNLADIVSFAEVSLSVNEKDNATVTLTPGTMFKGKMEIAKVAKGGGASASFAAYNAETTKFSFTHEDEVYIKMTAEDGKTVLYYGAKVLIGSDAGLKSITVGDQAVENFGTSATTLNGVTVNVAGFILMSVEQTDAGFVIEVTPSDADAKVSFGKGTSANSSWNESTWEGAKRALVFSKGDILGVKVVSQNGQVTNYYKIRIELMDGMDIPFGTPNLGTGDYVDPLWNDIPWIDVKNVNRAESGDDFADNPDTEGQAKLYWDAEGLWLYVDVTGPVSTNVDYTYQGSSVELFINEAYPQVNSGNYNNIGGQYRVDADGKTSGDPSAAVNALDALNKFKAWKKTAVSGYSVMFQAPWRFLAENPLRDNKPISLEIQINTANADGVGRRAVLKWYNTVANTYQAAQALARGTLKLNGQSLPLQSPSITTQPASVRVPLNGAVPALTVAAVSPDGGNLTYQWYSSPTAANTGGNAITGATSNSYQPAVSNSTVADHFYYVVVTNNKDGQSKPVTSSTARIQIYDPNAALADVELVSAGHSNWSAADNALVINYTGGQYGTFVSVPIPDHVSLEKYVRMDIKWDGYLADGSPAILVSDRFANDIIAEVFDGANVSKGNFGWNISAFDGDTYSYDLSDDQKAADFSGGQGKVNLNAKWGTNAAGIARYVIKSVKFIVEE